MRWQQFTSRCDAGVLALAVTVCALLCTPACMRTRYVVQAGIGQLDLWGNTRPVTEVLRDPNTDERTRILLAEAVQVRQFAEANGLQSKGNYRKFVQLDRGAVVWFMAASDPLSLEPIVWNFPVVGSFPYLGWFNESEGRRIAARLEREGRDVYLRRVHAYSTGGWFRDPIVSSMLWSSDRGILDLVNTLIHELTHANILINDQSTFNESIASYVGDTMADQYLTSRYGADSAEVVVYRQELEEQQVRVARLTAVYKELQAVYASTLTDAEKLIKKDAITRSVRRELDLTRQPNNASLLGFKTYNSGHAELAALHKSCGSWERFFAAINKLEASSFPKDQTDDIGPVVAKLTASTCGANASSDGQTHRKTSGKLF